MANFPNVTSERLNISGTFDKFSIGTEFDILFQPEYALLSLYVAIIIISLFANVMLTLEAVRSIKSVKNIYLLNLSISDLLVTCICMPIQISKAVTLVWYYGKTVCKIFNYIQGVTVAASVFTLTAMSVDRWLSISAEPRLRRPSRKQALIWLSLLWLAAMLIFIPAIIVSSVRKEAVPIKPTAYGNISIEMRDIHFCIEDWPSALMRKQFGFFCFTFMYAIPATIMISSYVYMSRKLCSARPPFDSNEGSIGMRQGLRLMKERKRVAWILLLLALLFSVCWLPYNVMQLLLDINAVDARDLSNYLPYALFLGHANSAINPIVYCLMTRIFQRSAQQLLCGRGVCKFTWWCTQKPERSSSTQMNALGVSINAPPLPPTMDDAETQLN